MATETTVMRERHDERRPPVPVGEDGRVVVEPDELGVVWGGQVVALQAQPHGVGDRVRGDRQHQQDGGGDQPERQPALGPAVVGAAESTVGGGLRGCAHGIRPLPSMAFCT